MKKLLFLLLISSAGYGQSIDSIWYNCDSSIKHIFIHPIGRKLPIDNMPMYHRFDTGTWSGKNLFLFDTAAIRQAAIDAFPKRVVIPVETEIIDDLMPDTIIEYHGYQRPRIIEPDTIPVIITYIDTKFTMQEGLSYVPPIRQDHNVHWMNGYEVISTKQYLDANKQPLPLNIIVTNALPK